MAEASCFLPSDPRLVSSLLGAPTTLALRAAFEGAVGTVTTLVLVAEMEGEGVCQGREALWPPPSRKTCSISPSWETHAVPRARVVEAP